MGILWGLKGSGPNALCTSSEKQCDGDSRGAERFEPESYYPGNLQAHQILGARREAVWCSKNHLSQR